MMTTDSRALRHSQLEHRPWSMPFELQIALRYLLAKRRQVFISVISLVSTLGVTVGVMALVISLAIMTGLQQELRNRILGAMAHVNVWKTGGITDYREEAARLEKVPGVLAAAPATSVTRRSSSGSIALRVMKVSVLPVRMALP